MDDPLGRAIALLGRLPGVGPRTAARLAFHLLGRPEDDVRALAAALVALKERLHRCGVCRHLTESDPCAICRDARRDRARILVLSSPQDLIAIERTGGYRGLYHVLHGVLSPLDGVGPDDLEIRPLLERLRSGEVEEVILGTSPNVEGDATALYLAGILGPLGVRVTRIASGVPIGGDLELADGVTLSRAIEGRRDV